MESNIIKNDSVGFYQELRDFNKDDEEITSFEFLENEDTDDALNNYNLSAYDYLHGLCATFAACLNIQYHYPMKAIYDENGELVHVWCETTSKKGNNVFVDVRGYTEDFKEMMQEFKDFINMGKPLDIRNYVPDEYDEMGRFGAYVLIDRYKNYYKV